MPSCATRLETRPTTCSPSLMPSWLLSAVGSGSGCRNSSADSVRDDEDVRRVDAPFGDLVAHRLAERHHQVGGLHAVRLERAAAHVAVAVPQVAGGAGAVPGQPGVLPEAAHLVQHRQLRGVAQRERDQRVGVVARRVQDAGPDLCDQAGRVLEAVGRDRVRAAGHDPRQQPVVRDAVDGHQATAVDRAGRDREADPGDDVRVESGITVGGALGDGDLLGADGVAGAGRRQRVGDDVQDGAGPAVPGRGQLRDVQAVWLEHVGLGPEPAPQPGRPPAARAVKRANRVGEPALPVGQPGGEPGPGTAAFRQAGHRRSGRPAAGPRPG